MQTHLLHELLVRCPIMVWATEGLFEEGEEDRDDDCSLERLSEDNEEDGHGKDVDSHLAEVASNGTLSRSSCNGMFGSFQR